MNRHNDAHAYTYKQTDTQTVKHIDPRRQAYRHTAGSGMCDYIYIIRKKVQGIGKSVAIRNLILNIILTKM